MADGSGTAGKSFGCPASGVRFPPSTTLRRLVNHKHARVAGRRRVRAGGVPKRRAAALSWSATAVAMPGHLSAGRSTAAVGALLPRHLCRGWLVVRGPRPQAVPGVVVHGVPVLPGDRPQRHICFVRRQHGLLEREAPVDRQPGTRRLDPGVHVRKQGQLLGEDFGQQDTDDVPFEVVVPERGDAAIFVLSKNAAWNYSTVITYETRIRFCVFFSSPSNGSSRKNSRKANDMHPKNEPPRDLEPIVCRQSLS